MTLRSVLIGLSRPIVFAIALWPLACPAVDAVRPVHAEIFTSRALPVAGIDDLRRLLGVDHVELYDLDAPGDIEKQLSIDLPYNEEKAAIIARERFMSGGQALGLRIAKSFHGALRARTYQLTAYPAIVFDHGAAVVYGPSIDGALARYQLWKQKTGGKK